MRWDVDVFAVALNVTVPLPLPLAPPLMVSHPALLVAVHVQPVAAVTFVVDDPAAEVSVRDVGETPKVQEMPLWVTETVWPATVSVPTRWDVDVLAVALKVTVPLPLPLAPPLMVSHPALLVAVHVHPVAAVTLVVDDPAADVRVAEVGETPKVQEMPLWVTVTVWPATVSVPTRCDVDVLAVALKVTVPLPLPLAPPLMVSHPALLVAVQVQPVAAVTVVVDDPAADVSVREVGETPKVQEMPLWVTVTVWPATVSVPTRCAVDVLAVALKVTVPLPEPLAPPLTASHPALLVAVHPHPVPAVTPVVDDPAAEVSVREVGDTANEHGAENWNVFDRVDRAVPPGPTAATVDS